MKLTTLDENQQLNWPIHLWPTTVCWCQLCRCVSVCFPVRWGSLQDDVRPPIHMPAPLFSKSRVSVKSAQMGNHTNAGPTQPLPYRLTVPGHPPPTTRQEEGGACTAHHTQGRAISAFPSSSSFPTLLLQASDAISRDGGIAACSLPTALYLHGTGDPAAAGGPGQRSLPSSLLPLDNLPRLTC